VGTAGRYWQVPVEPGTLALDLSTGTPDPALLPPLGPVLASLHAEVMVTSYNDRPVLPDLEEVLRSRWPCAPEAITVVDGAQDALDRIVTAHVRLGDTVVVEDPGFPPLLDMLELAGARIVGVAVDRHGIEVEALAAALEAMPSAMFVQPRAHNPTGASFDAERAAAIAALLASTDALVVEDDHSGEASGVDLHSIATHLPDRVLHVRSFSKTHGPDLRVAAIGGPAAALDPIVSRRRLGPSWTSRLTQRILLAMLTDASIEASIATAARVYAQRRDALTVGLASAGIAPAPGAGLNLWLDVADEQRAVVALAANGIGVAPGAPFRVAHATENIRISLGAVGDDLDRIAAAVAAAANVAVNR
jgi:DNA-binding transcriptional MocR family regulator